MPNYQKRLPLRIGQDLREQFHFDPAVEVVVTERRRAQIEMIARMSEQLYMATPVDQPRTAG